MSRPKTVVTTIAESEHGKVIALVVTPADAVTVRLLRRHHLPTSGTVAMYTPRGSDGGPADAMVVTAGLMLYQAAIDALYGAAAAKAAAGVPPIDALRLDEDGS